MKQLKIGAALAVAVVLLSLTAAPLAADGHQGFIPDLIKDLERVSKKLIDLAEATPAEKYSFRPSEEVRTVSEIYMHVVGTNMLLPPALGMPPHGDMDMPDNPFELMQQWEATVTAKPDVVSRLRQSYDYLISSVRDFPADDLDTEVTLFGPPSSKRSYLMVLQTHAHEHLGQSIAYARSQGIVPPWSQPAPAGGGEGEGEGEGEGDGDGDDDGDDDHGDHHADDHGDDDDGGDDDG